MTDAGDSRGAPPARPTPVVRSLALTSIAYLLDLTQLNRNGEDLLNGLLLATIVQANVARIYEDRELTLRFGAARQVPPDELRRPISVLAVAQSLQLPFETVRRRIRGLAQKGRCVFVEGGVIVPAAVLDTPDYHRNTFAAYERTRAFYLDYSELCDRAALPASAPWMGSPEAPVRAVARLTTTYMLRTMETLLTELDDFVDGLILLEVVRSNTENLTREAVLAAGDYVADELREPISVNRMAVRLGIPVETARRHVVRLTEAGRCVRVSGGLVVPIATIAQANVNRSVAGNMTNLNRLFNGLAQLGVLSLWQTPAADERAS